ncbi:MULTISPECIES: helix-turn-helix transcriptional regulator [unclassified Mesorhizobium]|uniref:helix-turn-helix domain-containing protein n=1 Tax=unclassified Mesorhizobium TaxID=325217 RepID=UPI0033355888
MIQVVSITSKIKTAGARLAWARTQAGIHTVSGGAEALKVPPGTYAGHESGNRAFDYEVARLYAAGYGVRWEWLLSGEGDPLGGGRVVPLSAIDQLHQVRDELRTIWLALGNTSDLDDDGTLTPIREALNGSTNRLEDACQSMARAG